MSSEREALRALWENVGDLANSAVRAQVRAALASQEEPVGYITEIDWGDGRGWIRQLYHRGSLIIHRTEEDAWSSMGYVGGIARTNGRVLPLFVGPALDATEEGDDG